MDTVPTSRQPRRNRGFEETHRDMIETAVRLISEKGMDALSIAALSREMGINRTTVYYHFDSREALLQAVTQWATEQLARGMDVNLSNPARSDHIFRFVLENPELIKLWIEGFVSPGDVREHYSPWDLLVEGTGQILAEKNPGEPIDAEVYCAMMLSSAIVAARVYHISIRPDLPIDEIVLRFRRECDRMLRRDGFPIEGETT